MSGFEKMELVEKQLDSVNVYDGNLLHVFRDNIMLPNGNRSTREYIKHNGAVAIVAMDDLKRIALEHQFRYPFNSELLEIPAGKLDFADEDPLSAAKRELREETGITAEKFEYLGKFYPSCAYSTEIIHMYLATGLSFGERELDEDESINYEMVAIKEVLNLIRDGMIPDGKTQTAVMKAALLLGLV